MVRLWLTNAYIHTYIYVVNTFCIDMLPSVFLHSQKGNNYVVCGLHFLELSSISKKQDQPTPCQKKETAHIRQGLVKVQSIHSCATGIIIFNYQAYHWLPLRYVNA